MFDVPDCECVILLRPTKSLSLYIQQSMRSMRYKENKQAIIIDHVGNVYEHGLPDYEHQWTLEDQIKKKKKKNDEEEEDEKIKTCKKCFAVFEPNVKICPVCGEELPVQVRKEKQTIEAELEEITQKDIVESLKYKPSSYYKKIKTLAELINFKTAKQYKNGWLLYKLEERKNDIKITFDDLKIIQKLNGYKFGWCIHAAEKYGVKIPQEYKNYRRYVI